jgi:hypothetical protein
MQMYATSEERKKERKERRITKGKYRIKLKD